MNKPQGTAEASAEAGHQAVTAGVETGLIDLDPAHLRVHHLHKVLPAIQADSVEWHAFVDAASAAGPEGLPPIYVTPEGFIMDGERRWRAARQLQWTKIGAVVRQEWEAATIIVESLLGQRSLSKGAKVYLSLPLMAEYAKAAEIRRLAALKRGRNLQKAQNSPMPHSVRHRGAAGDMAERLGVGARTVEQAVQIRRIFELPALDGHQFEFQDGSKKTLREHFEPLILDSESPMGLGEVLKGIGWFVDEHGKPKNQAPPDRNSHLFYWDRGWHGWAKQCARWEFLDNGERAKAINVVKEVARDVPEQVLSVLQDVATEEKKRRKKAQAREEVNQ